jgi:hypothetical protein
MKRAGVWIGGTALVLAIGTAGLLRPRFFESSSAENSTPDSASRASNRGDVEEPAARAHRQLQASIDKAGLRGLLDGLLDLLRDGDRIDQMFAMRSDDEIKLLLKAILEADDIPFSRRSSVVSQIQWQKARSRPVEALLFLDELDPLLRGHPEAVRILSVTVQTAAKYDPGASVDWYLSHLDRFGDQPTEVIPCGILANVAGSSPAAAFPLIDTLQMQDRSGAFNAIARGAHGAEQMTEVLEEVRRQGAAANDPPAAAAMETAALQGLASGLSGRHGAGEGGFISYDDSNSYEFAMSWLDSAHLSPDQLSTVAGAVDPPARPEDNAKWIDWMGAQLSPEGVAQRVGPMIAYWAKKAPGEAEQYLANATEGPVRDAGIEALVTSLLSHQDSDAAVRIAGMLPDGPKREKLLAAAALVNKGG